MTIKGDDPKLNIRKKMKGERTIEIGGQIWGWRVGKLLTEIIAPGGAKYLIANKEVEVVLDGNDEPTIAPGVISKYISRNILRN